MARTALDNGENFFEHHKALNTADWLLIKLSADAYREANALFSNQLNSDNYKKRILDLLLSLDILMFNSSEAIKRKLIQAPLWECLRKNFGNFNREPINPVQSTEISPTVEKTELVGSNWPWSLLMISER